MEIGVALPSQNLAVYFLLTVLKNEHLDEESCCLFTAFSLLEDKTRRAGAQTSMQASILSDIAPFSLFCSPY